MKKNVTQNEWISNLKDNHLEDLRASGLSDESIYLARIRSATSDEAASILGFKIECAALLFPYFDPFTGEWGEYTRVKPDQPVRFEDQDAKYLSPIGSRNRLYILPHVLDQIKNREVRIHFTEGEKKALKANQEGILCVGVSGVWNWGLREEIVEEVAHV